MLIRMAPGTDERERALRQSGQIPLAVPEWLADRMLRERFAADFAQRGKAVIREMQERERRRSPDYQEQRSRELRDTKPLALLDDSDPNRPVIAVGAGTAWREDLRDLARRIKEKPDPKQNPKHRERANVHNRLDMLAEANKWRSRGQTGVWHIKNNPLTARSD